MDITRFLKKLGLSDLVLPDDVCVINGDDIIPGLSEMEDYKFKILGALRIPRGIDPIDVFQVLRDMEVQDTESGIQVTFNSDAKPEIMLIIKNAMYKILGISQRGVLQFEIVDKDGNFLGGEGDCSLKSLPQTYRDIVVKYPDSYLRINGDLNVGDFIRKETKYDDSCINRLIVTGDFHCSKYSKVFPRRVDGVFDCRNLGKNYITSGLTLPMTPEINCAYSITDFDVLMGILPDNLEKLIVEPKLLRKDLLLSDKEHLTKVLDFMESYPDVTVLDVKGNNLFNVIQEIDNYLNAKQSQPTVKKVKTTKPVEVLELKVQGKHLDVKEVLACFRKLPEYAAYQDDVLERMIKCVLSDQRHNGIQKKMMRRADGANVVCIDASMLELVHQDLLKLLQERDKEKPEDVTVAVQKVEKPKAKVIKPIKIKKYITKSQLKDIIKSSGKNNAYAALSAINEINLDPLEMRFQGSVRIIKDGKETVSATVKKESGCCLVQSIDSSNHDDTKRIVWNVADGPDGLILVCVGFREHHNTKKASNMYEDLRSLAYKKKKYTAEDLAGYFDVNGLLGGKSVDENSDADVDLSFLDGGMIGQKMADMSHPGH